MAGQAKVNVRRARPGDAEQIAQFVNQAWRGRKTLDETAVIARFGDVGFLLAEQDEKLVGMLGWQVENLVVRLTDLLVTSINDRMAISEALLAEMEKAAEELQCEAILLFLPKSAPESLINFCKNLDYDAQTVADLPRAWKEAASEGNFTPNDTVMVKKLRDKRIMRPF
jgi:N-acetylglutamate synthase-like GNAT family acetyltransferase